MKADSITFSITNDGNVATLTNAPLCLKYLTAIYLGARRQNFTIITMEIHQCSFLGWFAHWMLHQTAGCAIFRHSPREAIRHKTSIRLVWNQGAIKDCLKEASRSL